MIPAYILSTWRTLLVACAACVLCFLLGDCRGERRGIKLERAEWVSQSNRILQQSARLRDVADDLAKAREGQTATQIKELRDAASKGTDQPVGDGVRAVIERMRSQGR